MDMIGKITASGWPHITIGGWGRAGEILLLHLLQLKMKHREVSSLQNP